MTENTPGTSHDPALGSEGDDDQLTQEDGLIDRGVDDLLDEGYSPPDRDPIHQMGGLDPDDPTAQQLRAEEPEVWTGMPGRAAGQREPDRAGRLEQAAIDGDETDRIAHDVGVAGGGASAEEAAEHVMPEYREPGDPVDVFTEELPDEEGED